MKNPSPRRPNNLRQQSPRRYVRKSFVAPEDEFGGYGLGETKGYAIGEREAKGFGGRPMVEGYSTSIQKFDLLVDDKTVDRIMGPDPIPVIDIEYSEIQNELQKKLVEEIQCYSCSQFPFMPLECKNCYKIFCQNCQIQMSKAGGGQGPQRAG